MKDNNLLFEKLITIKSKSDVDRLMKVYSKSILDAYIIIPDPSTDETDNRTSYFINWPMDLTDDDELPILQQYGLRSLGWSYKKSMTEGFYKKLYDRALASDFIFSRQVYAAYACIRYRY